MSSSSNSEAAKSVSHDTSRTIDEVSGSTPAGSSHHVQGRSNKFDTFSHCQVKSEGMLQHVTLVSEEGAPSVLAS